jgi:hypothetical protein
MFGLEKISVVSVFHDETSAQNYCRLVDAMVLVTRIAESKLVSRLVVGSAYLSVPTPPASRISAVSVSGRPVQRIANARRI